MNRIIEQALATLHKKACKIIREAFREHFGFEITEVEDAAKLEHIVIPDTPLESYRYNGETFLYKERVEIEIDPFLEKPEWPTIRVIDKYTKV